jgi:hypothetical protein
MPQADPGRDANVYGIGRRVMFGIWVFALWGTGTGIRLLWLFVTDEAKAYRLVVLPTVWVPIVIAVLMWVALAMALRNYRRHGEP